MTNDPTVLAVRSMRVMWRWIAGVVTTVREHNRQVAELASAMPTVVGEFDPEIAASE